MKHEKIPSALKIPLIYALIGGLWILLSDRVVAILFTDPVQLLAVQTYKGWFFIASTAFILFLLIRTEKDTLKRAEQNFSDLFEAATEGIFRSTPQGRYVNVNMAMAHLFGYASPAEMLEQVTDINTQIYLSAEDHRQFTEALERNNVVERFEARNLRKDGSVIWTSTNARTARDKNGQVLYYEGFVTDITKQKSAENALSETEKHYRMLVENLPAVVFMDKFNDSQTTQYMSPRLENLLGYKPEEWEAGNHMWENSLHPDDKDRVIAEDIRTDETGEPFRIEYRLRHRDGHYVWIKEDASIIRDEDGAPLFWQGLLLDISEQKLAEESLKRRDAIVKAVGFSAEQFLQSSDWEERINLVLEELGKATQSSRVYVFKKYLSSNNIIMVSRVSEWCRHEIEPQIENPELQNMDFAANGFSHWIELFDKGLPIYGPVEDFPEKEKGGLERQGILSLVCIPLQVGKDWWGFIGFDECANNHEWSEVEVEALKAAANTLSTAIEKKTSEEALLNSEASYRGLFNSIHDAIYIQDVNGVFLDANDGAAQMYGYPKEELIGKTPAFLSAPDKNDMDQVSRFIQRAFNGEVQQFEFWGTRSNGQIFPKDIHLSRGTYFGQDVVIAIAQDITERKRNESETQRQLKELTVLHAVALAESTSRTIDELLQQVTAIIGDMLYPDTCGILLLNEARDSLIPHFSYRGTSEEDRSQYIPLTKGITGKVAASGQPICTGDISLEPSYYEAMSGIRSELCVPVSTGQGIIGVLNVESRQPNAFTKSDERLLNTIAGGMAKTIERIQLFEMEQMRRRQAEILRETTGELTSLFETKKIFEAMFASLAKLIGYDSASIEVYSEGYFEIIAGQNIPQELLGRKYASNLEKWGEIYHLHQPVIIPDIQQDARFEKFEETSYIRGWMGIPLFAKDKIVGILNLDSRTSDFFNEEHAAIAQTFANQAAIAMENARLFELERHSRNQAEVLSQATSALANTLDINSLYENILDWLQKIAPYDSASIMLNNGSTEKLAAKRNLPKIYKVGQTFPTTKKWIQVAESRRPCILEDAQKSEFFERWEESSYIHGWMCTAMYTQNKLIGFINLDSKTPGAFTEEHGILIQTFANQAATAIENARLFELEQKRRKDAEIIRQAATILTNLLDLPSLHEAILEWLHKITPYDSASILELEGNHIRLTAARGLPNLEKVLNQTFSQDNTLCRIISETYEPLIIEDCEVDSRFENWGEAQNIRGWMGVPMISRGQVIGYITLDSHTPGAFTQNDAIATQTFAHQAATSLENSRLFTETKQRLEELEIVSRISFALRAARDTQEMLPILLNEIKASMGTDSAAIWLYEFESNELAIKAASGKFEDLPKPNFKPGEGIVGMVYSSGTAHITNGTTNDMVIHAANAKLFQEDWSGITVPIRTTSETIGALAVALRAPQKVKPHQTRLITTLAEMAGNAIHRSNLYERSEEQIQRLTTLRELDTAIASSLDLRITLSILTEHLMTKMGVSATNVLVFNSESQTLDYFASAGFKNQKEMRTTIKIGDGLAGQILLSRRAFYIKDLNDQNDPRRPKPLNHEQFRSYYAVPLFSKGATRGILETYFRQTFSPNADWIEFIHTLAEQAVIAIDNAQLFENLQQSNQELSLAYDTTLEGWGKALELRDKETQGHTKRVTDLTLELARQMNLPEAELLQIRRGALLHDIGKMGVPDNILRKTGSLTEEETFEMRKHPQYAYDMLYPIVYLRPALDIAYCHHEWWDGNGYPRKLKGEEIPLSARIFAITDVWDALGSDRPYRKAWEEDKIVEYIRGLSGKQFDPQIVEEFFRMIDKSGK
jgi:PAS domain S-box-containing protein/putative nucleotidyltransferase with HDIG domain